MNTLCVQVVVWAVGGGSVGVPPEGAASFSGIGQAPGGTATSVYGMSADGRVLTGSATIGGRQLVMRWSADTGVESLGELGDSSFSVGRDISADGSVIVGQSSFRAFRWTRASGLVDLGTLNPSGDGFASAWGVSDDGETVVGTAAAPSGFDVFRWKNGQGMTSEGLFDGAAISGDGAAFVATEYYNSDVVGLHGFLSVDGEAQVDLGDLPGGLYSNQPLGLSTDAGIVVGMSRTWPNPSSLLDGVDQAYVWREETGIVALGAFGTTLTSQADDVSDDGSVIVGSAAAPEGMKAAIWIDGGPIQRLETYLASIGVTDAAGWSLTHATSVSPDGMFIAGFGINPLGATEGWIVRIPGPAGSALIGLAVAWLGHRRRR